MKQDTKKPKQGGPSPKGAPAAPSSASVSAPKNLLANSTVILVLFVIFLAAYIITRNIILGLIAGALLLYVLYLDVKKSVKEHGWKSEIKDVVIAAVVAVGIWLGLSLILGTPSPLNAVVSCSMLPELQRGDMIVLQGGDVNAYLVQLSAADVNSITGEGAVYYGGSKVADVNGSMLAYCSYSQYSSGEDCQKLRAEPENFEEKHGPVTFAYGRCARKAVETGAVSEIVCVKSVTVGTKDGDVRLNFDDPDFKGYNVIVYTPKKTDAFSNVGDIIHRALFAFKTEDGKIYYLTKGDNNPIFDLQMYSPDYGTNSLVSKEQSKGRILARIPYAGYIKLILFGMVSTPSGCDSYIDYG